MAGDRQGRDNPAAGIQWHQQYPVLLPGQRKVLARLHPAKDGLLPSLVKLRPGSHGSSSLSPAALVRPRVGLHQVPALREVSRAGMPRPLSLVVGLRRLELQPAHNPDQDPAHLLSPGRQVNRVRIHLGCTVLVHSRVSLARPRREHRGRDPGNRHPEPLGPELGVRVSLAPGPCRRVACPRRRARRGCLSWLP